MKLRKINLLILLAVIMTGCTVSIADSNDSNAAGKEVLTVNDNNTISKEVLAANDNNTVSKEVLSTLAQRMQKKVSLDFRNTAIEDVLRIMADQSGVDIVKSPKVIGEVTATLTDIPLEEALNNILAAHGYGYIATNNMIRIVSLEEMTEVSERLVSKIYQINYANVLEVETALKKFLSPRGSLSASPGTSNIIVIDTESRVKAINDFIKEVDRITPQIEVEARIYDITSKDRLDLGIEWQAGRNTTYSTTAGSTATAASGTAGIVALENPLGGAYQSRTDPFTTGAFKGATGKAQSTVGVFRIGWLNPAIDVDMAIRAQQENIDAKLLANPRILVLDNQKANIKIVSEIPYQQITDTSAGGSIGSTAFREVGVELEVVPHLTREGMIRLQLKPKFSVQTGTVIVGTASNQFSQPVVDKREADTTLLIEDGQTVVLGGLRKKDVTKQVNKIPLLGDMPLIGAAFKFEGEDTTTSELVVFVTPRIIEEPVLTELNRQQLEVTDFNGPTPNFTRAEKPKAEKPKAEKPKAKKLKAEKPKAEKLDEPVLTDMDKQQLEVTDFNGPEPFSTRAEKLKAEKLREKLIEIRDSLLKAEKK